MGATGAAAAAAQAARTSYGRLVALLAWHTGDLAAAQDALAEAFAAALATWPARGVPDNPAGWLLTTARHRHLDLLRSAARRHERTGEDDALASAMAPDELDSDRIPDRRLQLMFVCAHPAIAAEVRAPLMLQTVLGLEVQAIARAFVLPPATLAQRLVRAKRKIKEAGIAFTLPGRSDMPTRLDAVLEAVYGSFAIAWDGAGEAWPAPDTGGPDDGGPDADLVDETRFLAGLLLRLLPDDPEVMGLNALLALATARRAARRSADGHYLPLAQQDTARWDHRLIAWGEQLLGLARQAGGRTGGLPGRFQLEAAIQSVHADRARSGHTDWDALALLYEGLMRTAPGLGAAVGRAVALGHSQGPAAGLAALDRIAPADRDPWQPAWAARAALLAMAGAHADAQAAYDRAIALSADGAMRRWLRDQQQALRS